VSPARVTCPCLRGLDSPRPDPQRRTVLPQAIAVMASAVDFVLALALGARAVGAADTSGYLSQAYLWLDGGLHVPQPLTADLPWPHPRESLTPLGYTPALTSEAYAAVPVYPPGLPLVFAGVIATAGDCAVYVVPAVSAALLVLATFLLGLRVTSEPAAAATAAALMASSPLLLFIAMTPMSDGVAAALWTSALWLVMRGSRASILLASAVTGMAILVRPNLVPLAAVITLAAGVRLGPWRLDGIRILLSLLGTVPAAVAVGLLNDHLYGSPLLSGYGPADRLYSLDHLSTNVRQFSTWFAGSEGLVLWPALLWLVVHRRMPRVPLERVLPAALLAAGVIGAYLFYLPFDAWWFLRFLLPAYPVLFIALGWTTWRLVAPAPPAWRRVILAVLVAAAVARVLPYWPEIAALGRHEERYAAVGRYVDTSLPPNAAIISMLHSGSIRFYSGRLVVRYDAFTPTRLETAIEWLAEHGYQPYLVIDGTEEAKFLARFEGASAAGRLERLLLAEWTEAGTVRVYDATQPPGGRRAVAIRSPHGGCVPPTRAPQPAAPR
jgi:hypothetical protein